MNPTFGFVTNQLKKHNIRLSNRRLKVLEYLCNNQNHPTVDQIYVNLHKDVPTLSKTTIYNTLHTLVEVGLVRVINIEDNETRYDILTEDHGHFKCDSCGKIFNFNVDLDSFTTYELSGFRIMDRNLYFKGICQRCLLNINKNY
ncbi:MAG: transcriptional repressor [Clostridiales bacterium]|nr:transcriptional repressor [Clostridiales bacterium]